MNCSSIKTGRIILMLLVCTGFMFSCKKENSGGAPVIKQIRLVDPTKKDSFFTEALPGVQVVIQGQNFSGLQSIYINEVNVPFNSALQSDNNIIITIPADIPTEATRPDVSNKLRVVTGHGEGIFDFKLVAPPPSITAISNELAWPGSSIVITGANFYNVQKVIFPGNIEVTNQTVNSPTQLTVTVPASLTASGPIQIVSKYGTGGNNFIRFNDEKQPGMLATFDYEGTPYFGWAHWGGIKANNAADFPGNRGNYIQIRPAGSINANDGVWYSDNRVVNVSSNPLLPAANLTDPIGSYALKFEMYQKTAWKNGSLVIRLGNPWTYSYRFAPYATDPSGQFLTNGWVTVSIPLTEFKTSAGNAASTLTTLLQNTNGDLGIMLMNDSNAPLPSYDAAFDNIRIVKVQ